ncbi:DapH/DapD/GlmU-related protein [Pectinatus haikarae]|uniref:Acetyltransferase n=1 Tax=Pectinatus haikarae TaxID=349096 RepID=A0ABT9Y9U5_9FIRM|nr:DapH/DapD/GlmU-related protein [Pectinatus haikarae]MDQ0204301.1 maltose O-acetyltransferase [Pectinatus haikarae]
MMMRERISSGKLFTDMTEGLPEERRQAKLKMQAFNASYPSDIMERQQILNEIFARETKAWIEPPFYFCYGTNIEIGEGSYLNFNCNFVDDTKIIVGKKVLVGPSVIITTVGHPVHPDYRGYMYAESVRIEDNCWIGAGVIICPGVTIGENSVIGAGSVVVKNIPANVVAVGNPCRILREIGEKDRKYYYQNREFDI